MADRSTIEATLERYYQAWTNNDAALYGTVWGDGATFADPPSDVDPPPLGFEQILAGFRDVQSRATGISYERQYTWHCGHSVAVHSIVTMRLASGVAKVPLVHTFRFDEIGRAHV